MCGTSHSNYTQIPETKKKRRCKKRNSPCAQQPTNPIIFPLVSNSSSEYIISPHREGVCKNKTFTIYDVRTQTYTFIYYVYEAITCDRQQSCTEEFFVFLSKTTNQTAVQKTKTSFKKKKRRKQNMIAPTVTQ